MSRRTIQTLFLPYGVSLILGLLCLCRPLPSSGKSVAVIGAGVHGLLAALELKLRGWDITVYEKAGEILPIIPSINLNGINYEYYSQAIFSPATFEGTGPNPSLARFAQHYGQGLPQPFAASGRLLYWASGRLLDMFHTLLCWIRTLPHQTGQRPWQSSWRKQSICCGKSGQMQALLLT